MIEYPASFVETRFISSPSYIVATEVGILHQLMKRYPDTGFYPAYGGAICPNMKLTTLENLLWCLEDESGQIEVGAGAANKAAVCIRKMLSLGGAS